MMADAPPEAAASTPIEWLSLPFFSKLPPFQSAVYEGEAIPKVLRFQCLQEDREVPVYLASVMTREEGPVWKCCREMIEHALKLAAQQMKGFYGYELIAARLSAGLEHFNPQDFSKLLANHGAKMSPGQKRLIQYGSVWGLLTQRIPEDWGKIEFKTFVETAAQLPERPQAYVRSLLKKLRPAPEALVVIHTLGEADFSEVAGQNPAVVFFP
jgi:hypothetical protein